MDQCPECKGRRLRATREERDVTVNGGLYTGFVRVILCKTCRAVFKDQAEEAAFVVEVERVAAGGAPEGLAPRAIHRRK